MPSPSADDNRQRPRPTGQRINVLPASRTARPSRRLTTVAATVSATSSSAAAPAETVFRSLKA
jgi:hypothetical protein